MFCHPELGTPLDPAGLTRSYVKPALKRAGVVKKLQPWHGLRHTALTMDAAVGNPNAYVQAKAGHSSFSITERYVHAAQVAFPGAVERSEMAAGNPAVFVDAPLVLSFAKDTLMTAECELYSGGVVFKPKFGDYAGRTISLIAWHGALLDHTVIVTLSSYSSPSQ